MKDNRKDKENKYHLGTWIFKKWRSKGEFTKDLRQPKCIGMIKHVQIIHFNNRGIHLISCGLIYAELSTHTSYFPTVIYNITIYYRISATQIKIFHQMCEPLDCHILEMR